MTCTEKIAVDGERVFAGYDGRKGRPARSHRATGQADPVAVEAGQVDGAGAGAIGFRSARLPGPLSLQLVTVIVVPVESTAEVEAGG